MALLPMNHFPAFSIRNINQLWFFNCALMETADGILVVGRTPILALKHGYYRSQLSLTQK